MAFRTGTDFMPILLRRFVPYGFLTLLVIATFANSLKHGFVWDDRIFILLRSDAYRHFDLYSIFLTLSTNGLEYLPIRDISYSIDFFLWGDNPTGFHFTNLLLYWVSVLVIFRFTNLFIDALNSRGARRFSFQPSMAALITAALFAVHPIHCEMVNFVSMRNGLLCGLFFFLSCHAYLKYLVSSYSSKHCWYVLATAYCICAMFSKAHAVILPLIFVLLTWYLRRPKRIADWLPLVPLVLLSCIASLFFIHVAKLSGVITQSSQALTWELSLQKMIQAVQIPFFYLYKIIFPHNLSVDYGSHLFGSTLTDPRFIATTSLLLFFSILICRYRSSRPELSLCTVWYLVTLVPVLHLFPTNPVVADRYAYLASYPVCLLLSLLMGPWFTGYLAGRATVAIIILISAATAFTHNKTWQSEKSLWEYTVSISPRSAMAHSNLARLYFIDENNTDKGLIHAQSAQLLNPYDTNFDVFKGVLNLRADRPQQALDDFYRALARDDQNIETLVNMSLAYQLLGFPDKACKSLRQAVSSSALDMPGNLRETAREMLRGLEGKYPALCSSGK